MKDSTPTAVKTEVRGAEKADCEAWTLMPERLNQAAQTACAHWAASSSTLDSDSAFRHCDLSGDWESTLPADSFPARCINIVLRVLISPSWRMCHQKCAITSDAWRHRVSVDSTCTGLLWPCACHLKAFPIFFFSLCKFKILTQCKCHPAFYGVGLKCNNLL